MPQQVDPEEGDGIEIQVDDLMAEYQVLLGESAQKLAVASATIKALQRALAEANSDGG